MEKIIDLTKLSEERKTIKNGIRFRPSVYKMLFDIADGNMAAKIEELIVQDYKNKKGVV